jgi:hypothetical protein
VHAIFADISSKADQPAIAFTFSLGIDATPDHHRRAVLEDITAKVCSWAGVDFPRLAITAERMLSLRAAGRRASINEDLRPGVVDGSWRVQRSGYWIGSASTAAWVSTTCRVVSSGEEVGGRSSFVVGGVTPKKWRR